MLVCFILGKNKNKHILIKEKIDLTCFFTFLMCLLAKATLHMQAAFAVCGSFCQTGPL